MTVLPASALTLGLCVGLAAAAYQQPLLAHTVPAAVADDVKVPVTLGVMSRCPDALLCESVFDRVLSRVSEKVNLTLSFIGSIDSSEPDFGVTCKHGPDECAGNVHELCAMKHASALQFWEFVQCENYQGRDKIGLPETALQCAKTANIDWEDSGVGACAGLDGSGKAAEGVQLLQDSVKASQAMGIKNSCTVLINGKQVCIHDGTWKECENGHTAHDFIRQINEEYQKLNEDSNSDGED
ncbi:uncharacterized protein LAESUDRAFT_718841 [Laetiporus sulphureus 93-53]|uniref:Gamma interferon inducible lysosomal thiol reductase GILT n=1 Tax=Laetiporus sulphureus 93-53 TaxID=1314785 RepID=A0A165I433_9APHY|nr:uncharacterized protein LAESUDRAFT_718841 [Laetiporus sulphureus 93-53]KZT12569.1 hypothetical protein LAESUDRAFT_718841 [Laetiporus sulphureus 93-53]